VAKVFQSNHPLIQHKLTWLRDVETEPGKFRELLKELTWLLLYEATANFAPWERPVISPMGTTVGQVPGEGIAFAPILRAGLSMVEPALELIPKAQVWHIGFYRDEETLELIEYYTSVPERATAGMAFILDLMLATGDSAVAVASLLKGCGVQCIKFVGIIAAPEGIERLARAHPDVPIYIAAVDDHLNEVGCMIPGLGNAVNR